ncbi:MAG: hypothetical protein U5K53_08415 [Halanaerobiales bacterium]|nr:hypothetical protein [Halanaerobiales bacterium]
MCNLDDNNNKNPIEVAENKIKEEYIEEFYSEKNHLKEVNCSVDQEPF